MLHSQPSSPRCPQASVGALSQRGTLIWSRVRFSDFVQFLTSEFARLHNRATQTAWLMILRSFLRYLSCEGHVPPGWDAALPSIATRKHISLPRGLSPEQVRALWLASEGRRPRNLRDRALLLVLLRLGLRAEEVADITLADIDWRSGCLKIRGAKTYEIASSLFRKMWDRPWLRTWTFRADTLRTSLNRGALRSLNNVGALTSETACDICLPRLASPIVGCTPCATPLRPRW